MEPSQETPKQVNVWFSSSEVKRQFIDFLDGKGGIQITVVENDYFKGELM